MDRQWATAQSSAVDDHNHGTLLQWGGLHTPESRFGKHGSLARVSGRRLAELVWADPEDADDLHQAAARAGDARGGDLQRADLAIAAGQVGGHYGLGDGAIEVTAIREITLADVTPELARRSGFAGVVDLLKVAKHGSGQRVFLVEFEYHAAM